mmetsp:Transcript_29967/g.82250  ORF Transcript_29967/g.82250 Transcript_29967/m.82250 type:complete len:275 (+) Transcript_29967:3-827(+)
MSQQRPNRRHCKPNELIVNYHDACIYGRDLALVQSSHAWLNDAVIHFFLMWLQHNNSHANDDKTLFLDPSVMSFLMHQCQDEDELQEFAAGTCRNFRGNGRLRLIVPINDDFLNANMTEGAGMHWSLLVLWLRGGGGVVELSDDTSRSSARETEVVALHLDSSSPSNRQAAKRVAQKIQQAQRLSFSSNNKTTSKPMTVIECAVPRQQNGYDCGVHVLISAEAILPVTAPSSKDPSRIQQDVEQKLKEVLDDASSRCLEVRRTLVDLIWKESES